VIRVPKLAQSPWLSVAPSRQAHGQICDILQRRH